MRIDPVPRVCLSNSEQCEKVSLCKMRGGKREKMKMKVKVKDEDGYISHAEEYTHSQVLQDQEPVEGERDLSD